MFIQRWTLFPPTDMHEMKHKIPSVTLLLHVIKPLRHRPCGSVWRNPGCRRTSRGSLNDWSPRNFYHVRTCISKSSSPTYHSPNVLGVRRTLSRSWKQPLRRVRSRVPRLLRPRATCSDPEQCTPASNNNQGPSYLSKLKTSGGNQLFGPKISPPLNNPET